MAGLPDKLVAQIAFKAGGDVYHQLLVKKPKHLAKAIPANCHTPGLQLHQGHFGTSGSVIQWNYILDGKEQRSKQVIDVDEEKKQITYKVIEGDLVELYKTCMGITFHVETKGGVDFITWTIEYELIDANNPHPFPLLNNFIQLTKALEAHIFG